MNGIWRAFKICSVKWVLPHHALRFAGRIHKWSSSFLLLAFLQLQTNFHWFSDSWRFRILRPFLFAASCLSWASMTVQKIILNSHSYASRSKSASVHAYFNPTTVWQLVDFSDIIECGKIYTISGFWVKMTHKLIEIFEKHFS